MVAGQQKCVLLCDERQQRANAGVQQPRLVLLFVASKTSQVP